MVPDVASLDIRLAVPDDALAPAARRRAGRPWAEPLPALDLVGCRRAD